jgi:cyclophilin family peptidyl-prolyl cis-trans isomerase
MTGKTKILLIAIALIVVAGVAALALKNKQGPADSAVATDAPAIAETASSAAPAAASSSYDLTPDSEGLSKAVATLTMENGSVIKWRFYTNDAPNTVKRIAQLISEGFYNGIVFHRVVPGFVVQAGDPTGTGASGSGVKLKAEFNKHKHVAGIVSMARTNDPDSADSQFFIMLGTSDYLDGKYTAFGKVVEGFANVQNIEQGNKIKTFVIQ